MSREKENVIDQTTTNSVKEDIAPPKENNLINVSKITDDLIADMPTPSQHAIDAHENKTIEIENKYKDLTDSTGAKFDTTIHRLNAQGEPVISKKGKFFLKNGTPKPMNTAKKSILGNAQVQAEKEQVQLQERCKATGTVAGQILFTLTQSLIGEDLAPEKEQRQVMVTSAFANYFQANNMPDLPPGWALIVAIVAYVVPQLTQKPAQEKMKTIGAKMFLFLQSFKRKKQTEIKEPENRATIPPESRGDNK